MSNWNDCLEQEDAIKASINKFKAESLIETAKGRIDFTKEPNNKNANYVFEDYYTSLIEILHAKAILKGFKIKNHLCLGFFLRDFLNKPSLFRIFDDLRYKRNSLVYYGKRMEFETCLETIKKCKRLINEIGVLK